MSTPGAHHKRTNLHRIPVKCRSCGADLMRAERPAGDYYCHGGCYQKRPEAVALIPPDRIKPGPAPLDPTAKDIRKAFLVWLKWARTQPGFRETPDGPVLPREVWVAQ